MLSLYGRLWFCPFSFIPMSELLSRISKAMCTSWKEVCLMNLSLCSGLKHDTLQKMLKLWHPYHRFKSLLGFWNCKFHHGRVSDVHLDLIGCSYNRHHVSIFLPLAKKYPSWLSSEEPWYSKLIERLTKQAISPSIGFKVIAQLLAQR